MKIYLSNYRDHWISPYTILEKVFFWREIDYDEPIIEKLSDILEPISIAIQKFLDFIYPQIRYVKIDNYDTWNMDSTLAHIILPMLKQLKATKHGSPHVDLDDVPEHMRTTTTEDWDPQLTFDFYKEDPNVGEPHFGEYANIHDRWNYVLNEMIFAFEHLIDDSWENEFSSGKIDFKFVPCPDNPKLSTMEDGPNHTYQCDYDGLFKVYARMDNGFRLFGKYYRGLWD